MLWLRVPVAEDVSVRVGVCVELGVALRLGVPVCDFVVG
jgi:hypothetical protein